MGAIFTFLLLKLSYSDFIVHLLINIQKINRIIHTRIFKMLYQNEKSNVTVWLGDYISIMARPEHCRNYNAK